MARWSKAAALGLAIAGAGLVALAPEGTDQIPDLESYREAERFYASRPFEERPQAGWQAVPEGLVDLKASSCGECHSAIYSEWQVSTHGQAWTDVQFQMEMKKSENRWLCRNCHSPLLNQMAVWAVGLEDGDVERPRYVENSAVDLELQNEGITCSACHVRDGAVEGPTGIETAAHPTRKAERFLTEEICLTCHQAVRSYPGKDFICVFDTGTEWREGPYSGQTCQFCHMPPVYRPQADAEPPRSGRHHYWPGAGIYKVEGVGPPLELLGPGLGVEVETRPDALDVTLSNSAAGHLLPTGDPERHITVEVAFSTLEGDPVGEPRTIRIGQVWEWWPEPKKLDDNRLAPLEERLTVVERPAGAERWSLVATSHRITAEVVEYHDLEGYPASRITHELSGRFELRP